MAPMFQHWYDKNAQRAYPCHDASSRISDSGERLPDSLIVDANIWVPEPAGRFVFLSSATVSERIVSVTFAATDENPFGPGGAGNAVPVASLSVVRPVAVFRNYNLESQYAGTAGWVVFGPGADLDGISLRFSAPGQTALARKAARHYAGFPIGSLRKTAGTPLSGDVVLRGGNDISVRSGKRMIDGVERDVILVGLNTELGYDVLSRYLGPCDGRPESGTCGKRPIQYINGVPPDCEGNLEIEFAHWYASSPPSESYDYSLTDHGIVLDFPPFGLSEVCAKKLPYNVPQDRCVSDEAAYVVFIIPSDPESDPLHFQIQFASSSAFDPVLAAYDSTVSQASWDYWSSSKWKRLPAGGVPAAYYGEKARFSAADTGLERGRMYWYRIRAWDGSSYGEWSDPQTYYLR